MGSEGRQKNLVVTQISVGGFDNDVTAKMLADYFERNVGTVYRCRLKTSSTPADTFPEYNIDCKVAQKKSDYEKVTPHAFLHFASSEAAQRAMDAASRGELTFRDKSLKVSLGPENPHRLNERRRTEIPYRLSDVQVEIGVLLRQDEFVVSWRGDPTGFDFLVDPFNSTCSMLFARETAFSFKNVPDVAVIKCDFKVSFLVREILSVEQYQEFSGYVVLLRLFSAPHIYYRTADDDIEISCPFDLLDDDDPWIRTTDFTPSGAIGRCNTFRILVPPRKTGILRKALSYLRDCRVHVKDINVAQRLRVKDEPDFGMKLSNPFFCIQSKEGISFKVMFLVNAVLHKCIINQHQMSDKFFDILRRQREEVNLVALKHIYSYKLPLYDACKKLESVQQWLLKNPNLIERPKQFDDVVEIRRLIITPAKAYCLPPEVELSNRVLRHYRNVADRFLRVTFMDEGMQMLNKNVLNYFPASIVWDLSSNSSPQKTVMFRKVKAILTNGFYLCGRKYSFLAFSANQLRDRSAWFFAEGEDVRVPGILKWMGKFGDRNVAKCAARMGQCFSSTYATVEVPQEEVLSKCPDIQRNGHVFSDGIGMVSADLATKVAEKLKLSQNPPCAYQIRYAGYKGVVACWPKQMNGRHLYLRESMHKFDSNHRILEICSWTRFQPGFLNRQIITLLSALGVIDNIYWKMQESMIFKLNQMLDDVDVAFDVLTASCAEQGNTAAIMLSAGFEPKTEPHLRGMLNSIRTAQLRDLRERARIFVPRGRWLMGCFDELAVLEQGQCFIQVSHPSLETCFSRHGSIFSKANKKNLQVITGLVAVAKNPCLHPGDVRILEGVDIPELRHLDDCLVFPQKGDRPHTNEASGSDLDGDLYFVTWDENLIPPSKRSWIPMDYAAAETIKLPRDVNQMDIIEFFTKNMVTESLGTICNAHVVHADLSEYGALDEKCIKLAELAATAVDFPKTGKVVNMPANYKPKLYPDFMEKEDFQSYRSNKILGKLYRHAKDACGQDEVAVCVTNKIRYDKELEVEGSDSFIMEAWSAKCSYDGQLQNLLGQYKVNHEEEVVTGHIWSMPKHSSKKLGELKERLKHAYTNLKKEFRKVFEEMEPGFDNLSDKEKNIRYERKASAWYQVTYHPIWLRKAQELHSPDEAVGDAVMLSFPWVAVDYIAQIKIRKREMSKNYSRKPIDALGRYLTDKI